MPGTLRADEATSIVAGENVSAFAVQALDANFVTVQDPAGPQAVEADGKLLVIAPGPDGSDGVVLQRYNPDGSLDAGFDASALALRYAESILALPDGRILVAGQFGPAPDADAADPARLVRLNADGSLDAAFVVSAPAVDWIDLLHAASDGRVLVGGTNWSDDDTVGYRLVRLNADGSMDSEFQPNFSANETPYSWQAQPDGKLVFSFYSDASDGELARLNVDGSRDDSFQPALPPGAAVDSFAALPDGRLIVAASFPPVPSADEETDDGSPAAPEFLARLEANGDLDASFTPPMGIDGSVSAIFPLPGGSLTVQGYFANAGGATRRGLAKFGPDGTLDAGFDPLADTGESSLLAVAPQADGGMVLAYELSDGADVSRCFLTRFDAAGRRIVGTLLPSVQTVSDLLPRPAGGAYAVVSNRLFTFEPVDLAGSDGGFSPPPSPGVSIVKGRPKITLTALPQVTSRGRQVVGKFLLQRGPRGLSRPLRVKYLVSGSAIGGRDYQPLRGTRVFKAGQSAVQIKVRRTALTRSRGQRGKVAVRLILQDNAQYRLSPDASAKIRIPARGPAASGSGQ